MSVPQQIAAEPDWIAALRAEVDRTSQDRAGRLIGYSAGAVCGVLTNTYRSSTTRIEQAVRGALMGATIECPVLGDLRRDICIKHQARKFAATNPARVQLYQACRGGCPHSSVTQLQE